MADQMKTPAIVIAGSIDPNLSMEVPAYSLKEDVGEEKAFSDTKRSITKTSRKALVNWSVNPSKG